MRDIIDYKKDEAIAVPMIDKYLMTRSGQRRLRKTTQGWRFLVNWKDGTESWVKLAELKDSYPVKLAEFATARGIANEPAFAWWVTSYPEKKECDPFFCEGEGEEEDPQVWD
jgi:hypothetical protein